MIERIVLTILAIILGRAIGGFVADLLGWR